MATATKTKADKATDSAATETPAATEAETVIDLSGFQSVVATALSTADETTGTIPEAGLAQTLASYRELPDVKNKNAARTWLDEETRAAVMSGDILKARSAVEIKENLSSGSSSSKAAPKDPTEAYISKVAQLSAAYSIVVSEVPEGVSEDWNEKSQAKAAELVEKVQAFNALAADADDSEFGADVKKVAKLASGRGTSGSTYSGVRRDTNKHLAQVFADLPVGSFLTVTEISKAESEEYGDDHPTTGAVSARLFPKSGKPQLPEGIEEVIPEDGSARGARKVA